MEKDQAISGLSVEEMITLKDAVDMTREHPGRRISISFRNRLDKLSIKLREELFLSMTRADYEDMFGEVKE